MMTWMVLCSVTALATVDEPKPPAGRDDELAALRAQIARDMQAVENKLKAGDAGDDTRGLQKQIVENIDKLMKKAQEPPSGDSAPKSDSASKPQNNPSTGNSKPGPAQSASTRRERRQAQRKQQPSANNSTQRAGSQPQPGTGQPTDPVGAVGRTALRTGPADSMADVAKDIWGHLPESLRQEVDHYYREQFMPRYRDLLQQYYLRLAETERRPGANR